MKACTALDWLDANKMIANSEKFMAIILQKSKSAEVSYAKFRSGAKKSSNPRGGGIKIDNVI